MPHSAERGRGPPVPASEQLHQVGDEQGADDGGVDQDGGGDAEAEFFGDDDPGGEEGAERNGEEERGSGDDPGYLAQ